MKIALWHRRKMLTDPRYAFWWCWFTVRDWFIR
jgi:hypothetical protein